MSKNLYKQGDKVVIIGNGTKHDKYLQHILPIGSIAEIKFCHPKLVHVLGIDQKGNYRNQNVSLEHISLHQIVTSYHSVMLNLDKLIEIKTL